MSEKAIAKKDTDDYNRGVTALVMGVVGLVIMAILTLAVAVEFIGAPVAAGGFSGFMGLMVAIPAAPWYLILGIVCWVSSARASELYKKDLRVVGILSITGLLFVLFGTIFFRFMWLAWLIYYGSAFIWLAWRVKMRQNVSEHAQKIANKKKNSGKV